MSLVLALIGSAWADRLYWTAPPSPADIDAAERTLPDARAMSLDGLVTGTVRTGDPAPTLDTLRRELDSVRPLVNEFDGELQIMARLAKATADVEALRNPDDTELLWEALCFQGFAVHRYFGDRLGTDPAAAPYRVGSGADAQVAAWIDAAALFGPREPRKEDIPEDAQRLAFDGVRAMVQVMPAASLAVGQLASGATLMLDGRVVDTKAQVRTLMVPGRHFLEVRVGDTVLLRGATRIGGGSTMSAEAPFGPAEREALAKMVGTGGGWTVPAAAMLPITGAGEPVYLGEPGNGLPRLLRVDRGTAETIAIVMPAREQSPLAVHVTLGGGWLSTGDFFLQNVESGAPYDESSVNAFAPVLSADGEWRAGLFAASVGATALLATGEFHSLTTGDTSTNAFVYPHAGVGLTYVQATVGPLFPWYLGVGGKARVAVWEGLEVSAGGVYGVPLDIARSGNDPAFTPQPAYAAWGGAGWVFD
ncbi:MAG: hypothetical protein FJ090_20385 [Deltaproteobacteria bacterium]|nr:hypothetical protein [Deltaproteobacteria bacterium]